MDESTEALLARCAAGDQAAWNTLVNRFAGLVFAVARRQGLRPDQCEDCAQAVFSVLVRRFSTIEHSGALASWLTITTRREAWRIARDAAPAVPFADGESGSESADDDALHRLERAHAVHAAMAMLGPQCRRLIAELFLTRVEPDYQSIAARLSIPVGSIGPTRRRCLAKLAELIGTV